MAYTLKAQREGFVSLEKRKFQIIYYDHGTKRN